MSNFKIVPIPSEQKRGWTVKIDGEEVKTGKVEITSKYGTLTYGLRPEGYDGWAYRLPGGGSAVTLPYSHTPSGELLVGLLLENRLNMGGKVWCVIGGFVGDSEPKETYHEAQVRESSEEGGLDTSRAGQLPGLNSVSDRLFFHLDINAGEGVRAYGQPVPFTDLKELSVAGSGIVYRLQEDSSYVIDKKKAELLRFLPWRYAIRVTGDALARSAIAQLLAEVL